MARPIPPERHSSQSTSTYGFNEVDKFLKNSQNTNFMPNYNLSNGLRYESEPRRRELVTDEIPSPDTLYDRGNVSNAHFSFIVCRIIFIILILIIASCFAYVLYKQEVYSFSYSNHVQLCTVVTTKGSPQSIVHVSVQDIQIVITNKKT